MNNEKLKFALGGIKSLVERVEDWRYSLHSGSCHLVNYKDAKTILKALEARDTVIGYLVAEHGKHEDGGLMAYYMQSDAVQEAMKLLDIEVKS